MADLSLLQNRNNRDFTLVYVPRSFVQPIFSETVVAGIVRTWAALSLEWELVAIRFPVLDGVKSFEVDIRRVLDVNMASIVPGVLLLGGALFVFLSLREVRLTVSGGGAVGFSLLSLAVVGVAAVFILREVR